MIKGDFNREQCRVLEMLTDIIGFDSIDIRPFYDNGVALSGGAIYTTEIREILNKGLLVFYTSMGELAVYKKV